MLHTYLISDSLDEIEQVHDELVEQGIPDIHQHVLSDDDAGVTEHHLRSVNPFNKTDIVRCTIMGAVLGFLISFSLLSMPFLFDVTTPIGAVPFVFGALVFLGLFTWEGGLIGLHKVNHHYQKIDKDIHNGKHLLIVDHGQEEFTSLNKVIAKHSALKQVEI